MDKSVLTRAAIGACFIGVGLSLMLSASRQIPCSDCDEKHAEEVAEAAKDIAREISEPVEVVEDD